MIAEFKLNDQCINMSQMEHYILHTLRELNSKRNDGWVEEHYKKELVECKKVLDEHLRKLSQDVRKEETVDWVKKYEYEKIDNLRKKIDEVQCS